MTDKTGTEANNDLIGGTNNDTLTGLGGVDRLYGNGGNDILYGGDDRDELYGGDGDDEIYGGSGHNQFEGGSGHDTMVGEGGDDEFFGDSGDDVIDGGDGWDGIFGGDDNDTLRGGGGSDDLWGEAGNDRLDGGSGADWMEGGSGDDIYVVNTTDEAGDPLPGDIVGDFVFEEVDEGIDEVQSSVDYTLGANVENLTLTGTSSEFGIGNDLDNVITGTEGGDYELAGESGDDVIYGGGGYDGLYGDAGNDALYGGALGDDLTGGTGDDTLDGGTGADHMIGGKGDDVYIVDNNTDNTWNVDDGEHFDLVGDQVEEELGEGTDLVRSSVNYTLGANVENLTLTGSALEGTGNDLGNIIIGNDGDNELRGEGGNDNITGGLGSDALYGGAGADILKGDQSGSLDPADGNDSLYGGAGEDMLVGYAGDDSLVGGADDDILSGMAGNDVLDGGTGADRMGGGAGDDVYIVDTTTEAGSLLNGLITYTGDVVLESTNEGIDEVQSSVDYTLGDNVENLTLTGDSDLKGTGNKLDNEITGNAGDNTIDGGSGDDTMSGGEGKDTFIESGNDGADTILDFGSDDFVDLSKFYNHEVVSQINEDFGTDFSHSLGLLRADHTDGSLDGKVNGEDYSKYMGGIDLSLQLEGNLVNENDPSARLQAPFNELLSENTNVACFNQGTLIRAQNGEVLIENLKPGDLVWTQDNGLQPVSWIGSQKLTDEELRKNPNVRPIRIKKGALGLELPSRDLVVSPQHRILISSKIANRMTQNSEVLIAAKFLTQIPGISTITDIEPVEYFHLMFETHQLITAEGALAESFYLGSEAVKGLQPAARLELEFLFPMLFEKSFMPKPVRPFISGKRGRKIASRHMKNSQPLFNIRRA